MKTEVIQKIGEKLQDEVFSAKFQGVSKEEALEILKAEGFDITMEDLESIGEFVSDDSQELSVEALDTVAGGLSWNQYWKGLKSTLRGFWDALCGK